MLLQRGAAVPVRAARLRRERRRVVRPHRRPRRQRQGECHRERGEVPAAEDHTDADQGKDGRKAG